MDYEDDMRAAAHAAVRGVNRAIKSLATGLIRREDDLSGVLKGNLDAELDGRIGHLTWQCANVDHGSGRAALEREFGADILIHVSFDIPTIRYSKGVLVQAKKQEPGVTMSSARHTELVQQCNTMLKYTPAAFVFDYYDAGLRCGSAALISGSNQSEPI